MWAHYANCHQGVAFKFNRDIFNECLKNVDYQKSRTPFDMYNATDDDFIKHCHLKSEHWNYEQEERLLLSINGPNLNTIEGLRRN